MDDRKLRRLKWLTTLLVITFMLAFEYARHFVWKSLLHTWSMYVLSVAALVGAILFFNQVLFAVLNRMQKDLLRQNKRLATLNSISSITSRSLDLDATLNAGLEMVMETVGLEAAAIHLLEADCLTLKVHRNLPDQVVQSMTNLMAGEGLAGKVAASGQALVVADPFVDAGMQGHGSLAPNDRGSLASIPLLSKGKVVGVLTLTTREQRELSAEDQDLLEAIGNQIGVAIENAELHTQVQQQARHLNAVIEGAGNAIVTTDSEGRVLIWNHGAEEIYGWTRREAMGQFLPMTPPERVEEARRLIHQVLKSGKPLSNIETRRLRKDGSTIPVMVTVSAIRDAGDQVIALLDISTDMREKKKWEQDLLRQQRALAVMEERERLARELHDSLGQILGYVNTQAQAARELLSQKQHSAADSHLRRLIEVVQRAHTDVREYILSLQAGSSMEQGLLPAVAEYLESFSRNTGIGTELLVSNNFAEAIVSPTIEVQLLRIVQEALTNVRKHARAHHVRVSFGLEHDQGRLVIEDDGIGFEPAEISPDNGMHFGLKIMRERAEQFGGEIQIQSEPGQGAKLIVRIPLPTKTATEEKSNESFAG